MAFELEPDKIELDPATGELIARYSTDDGLKKGDIISPEPNVTFDYAFEKHSNINRIPLEDNEPVPIFHLSEKNEHKVVYPIYDLDSDRNDPGKYKKLSAEWTREARIDDPRPIGSPILHRPEMLPDYPRIIQIDPRPLIDLLRDTSPLGPKNLLFSDHDALQPLVRLDSYVDMIDVLTSEDYELVARKLGVTILGTQDPLPTYEEVKAELPAFTE